MPCFVGDYPLSYTLYATLLLDDSAESLALLAGLFGSLVFDWLVRQKTAQPSLPLSCVEQVPIPTKEDITRAGIQLHASVTEAIRDRVLELTYTSHDLQAYAQDLGYAGSSFGWDGS